MIIGIDFDNTIACYDPVFQLIGVEEGLPSENGTHSKGTVRDGLRARGLEERWIEIQGLVYGARMSEAVPYPGFLDFVSTAKTRGIQLRIVSHKTQFPFRGPQYDLHAAARGWLNSLSDRFPECGQIPAFFELTKPEKLGRIGSEGCDLFIDDLPEILLDPQFPSRTKTLLFDPDNLHHSTSPSDGNNLNRASSWSEISKVVFNG